MSIRGQVLPAVDIDGRAAYAAAASLARIDRVLFAERLREIDHLDEVRTLSAAAAVGHWEPFFDRATYEHHALTRCLVLPRGAPWPIEVQEHGGPRLYVQAVTSSEPMKVTFGDVMVASCLGGRPATVLSATGLQPDGCEKVLPIPLRDGVVVPVGENPIAALVRLRPPKGVNDRLRACIRGVANPAAWGIFARLDQRWEMGSLV